MKLPERFVLTIEGKLWNVRQRSNIATGELPHFFAHLIAGNDFDMAVFEAFGLRVTIEPCTDQGEDGPDDLAVGSVPSSSNDPHRRSPRRG